MISLLLLSFLLLCYYCSLSTAENLHSRISMHAEVILALLPGAAQGLTTVALGHPFDTVKTRMQALGPGASSSFLRTMWNVTRAEGVRALYRAAVLPLLMSATKRGLQFAIWDTFRQQEHQDAPLATSPSHSRDFVSRAVGWVGASSFLSGAVAGGVGTFIGCPMHVIKIRTQFLTRSVTRNVWTCAMDIYRTEGLRGYFCGFRYHLLKDMCFACSYLGLYDAIKRWLCAHNTGSARTQGDAFVATALRENSKEDSMTHLVFFAGSLSSMATWVLLYPLDTIKTIVQARNVGLVEVAANFKREARCMYRGLGASLMRAGPVCGVAMVVYEHTKEKTNNLLQ